MTQTRTGGYTNDAPYYRVRVIAWGVGTGDTQQRIRNRGA